MSISLIKLFAELSPTKFFTFPDDQPVFFLQQLFHSGFFSVPCADGFSVAVALEFDLIAGGHSFIYFQSIERLALDFVTVAFSGYKKKVPSGPVHWPSHLSVALLVFAGDIYAPASLDGWRRVVQEVHAAGGKIAPQLWHMGMVRKPGTGPHPDGPSDGPSGLSGSGKLVAEPMTDAAIADTIAAFADAAERAKEIGFDAIELHGAHGYLIDQFFWEQSNRRTDNFGGDLVKRTRFASEIVQAVRRRVGADFAIILRFSQWKQQDYNAKLAASASELSAFLEPLTAAGVDIFHCSTRRFWEPEFEGSSLNLAGWTKKISGKPTITVGSVGLKGNDFTHAFKGESAEIGELGELEKRLQQGEFDLVAVGRALITDPQWPAKVRDGRYSDLSPFSAESLATL